MTDRIYLKQLIETATLAKGWSHEDVSKKIMYCYKHNCFSDFARFERGKLSYQKALVNYQQKKLNRFCKSCHS